MARSTLLALFVALGACGPVDRVSEDATTRSDATTTTTSAPDVAPLEGTVMADGMLVPPSGSATGWVVMNRFASATLAGDGQFKLPVAEDGLTLTIAHPVDHPETPLLAWTLRVVELDHDDPTLTIDLASTAETLVLMHARVLPQELWRLRALHNLVVQCVTLTELGTALRSDFASWTQSDAVRASFAAAVSELVRRASPPWDATLPVALPRDPEGVRIVRGPARPIATVEVDDGKLAVVPLPSSPPLLTATLRELDSSTTLAAVVRGDAMTPVGEPVTLVEPLALQEGLYQIDVAVDVPGNAGRATSHAMSTWGPDEGAASVAIRNLLTTVSAASPIDASLTADPDQPLAPVLDPRRGPLSETLVVVVGDPFAARFDAIDYIDGVVIVAGRHLERVTVVDERGRTALLSDGRWTGELSGALHLRAETASGFVDSAVFTTVEAPAPVPPPLLNIIEGPDILARGESAVFVVEGAGLITVRDGDDTLPLRVVADDRLVIDTSSLAAGAHELTFENPATSRSATLTITEAAPTYARDITFHATLASDRVGQLATALDLANGTRVAHGDFGRRDLNVIVTGGWYCPLDITPADATATPAPLCSHFTGTCDDLWLWDDTRDSTKWLTVTRPPGRSTTGAEHCPVIAGPSSWSAIPRSQLHDRITSDDIQYLAGVVRGPNVELALGNVRGGGLVIAPPLTGGRSEVVIDLTLLDATNENGMPVVMLDGVSGVTIRNLRMLGRPTTMTNGCAVGLRIKDSHDVRVEGLSIDQCDRAVEVVGSSDIKLDGDIVVTRAKDTALTVSQSEDVFIHARLGHSAGADNLGSGIVVSDSERVTIGGSITSTSGDALRIQGGSHLRVGPLDLGFRRNSEGGRIFDGTRVRRGILVAGAPDDLQVYDVIADYVADDAITLAGGTRVHLEHLDLGKFDGVEYGVRLTNDIDVVLADVYVGHAEFDGIRSEARGRQVIDGLVVEEAGACGLSLAAGSQGVRVSDAELGARVCARIATDATLVGVTAPSLYFEQSFDLRVERATTGLVTLQDAVGVTMVESIASEVKMVGPGTTFPNPVTLVDTTLTKSDGPALSASDTHMPIRLKGVTADALALNAQDSVTIEGGHIGSVTLTSGRLFSFDSDAAIALAGGELVASGAFSLSGENRGSVTLNAPDADVTLTGDGVFIAEGGTLGTLDLDGHAGSIMIDGSDVDTLVLDRTIGARVSDVSAGAIDLGRASDAWLARVSAEDGVVRGSGARRVRTYAMRGLAPLDGDPTSHGVVVGEAIHITAAPAHALVELLRGDEVVARAFASDGEVLFRDVAPDGIAVQTTLLDGTSGPPIALATAVDESCVAEPAPSDVSVLTQTPACELDGGIVDATCSRGVKIVDGDMVLVDLTSGVETTLVDDGTEARDPAFGLDEVWFARRALGGTWTLATVDLESGLVSEALVLPGDALWPAPAPDGSAVAFASCPDGEAGTCHLALLDDVSGAVGIPAEGGWPAARACDERHPTWVADPLDETQSTLVVSRRSLEGTTTSRDVMSPLGLVRWRL